MSNVQMLLLDNVVGHCFKIESTPSPTTNTKSVCTMKPIKPLLFQGPFPLQSLPGRLGEVSAGDALTVTNRSIHPPISLGSVT